MPCNAKVVLIAKAKVVNRDKFPIGKQIQINSTVNVIVDKDGNATLRYTGDSWDEGVKTLGLTLQYMKRFGVDFESIGKPETHRHSEVAHQQMATH